MKKLIAMGCLMLGVMFIGTACSRSQYNEEVVTDEVVMERLDELAKTYLQNYYEITVNNDVEMTATAVMYVPEDETSGLSTRLVLLKKQEGDPTEGQLYSYQIMVDAETDEMKGLYYGVYSKKEPINYTETQLDEIGRSFIAEKQMVTGGQELSLIKVQKVSGADYIQSLTYQYGERYLLININSQDGKVMGFEYNE